MIEILAIQIVAGRPHLCAASYAIATRLLQECLGAASATAVQSQRLVLKMANRTTAAQIMITAEAMKPARSPNPG
jgi:hypothetical protein